MRLSPAPAPRVIHHRDRILILGEDGRARELCGDAAALARAVLDFVTMPRDRGEILAHLERLSGDPLAATGVIDDLLDLLCAARVLQRDGPAPPPAAPLPGRRVVLGLTGAVATMHAPALAQLLLATGCAVQVAMTRAARRFVSPRALEALTHAPVHTDLWRHARGGAVPHIDLARWAELVLLCPASATTISRLARGDCADIVSAIAIATRAKVVVVPSMNPAMLGAPAVARNLAQLRDDGLHVVQPGCGFEVADAPAERAAAGGAAPGWDAVVAIVRFLLGAPAVDWEQTYAASPLEALPWFTHGIEPDIEAALARFVPPGARVLDIGTGPGTFAITMARRGHRVSAIDISESAIRAAQARAGDLAARIDWHAGDFLATPLDGPFALAHDRGCLHALPRGRHAAYRERVADLLAPGGLLFLKTFAPGHPHPPAALAFSLGEIAELFAPRFAVVHSEDAGFAGEPPLQALFVVLMRTGP